MAAAAPGLSELVTTTLRNRRGVYTDNLSNNNPISRSMKRFGTFEMESGGRTLVEEALFQENATVGAYYGAQPFSTAYNDTGTAWEVDWKQFGGALVISGREERMNAGEEQSISVASGRMDALEYTMENYFNSQLFADGTGNSGLDLGGLKYWVSSTPTTGTVGGIDRSTTGGTFSRNFKFDTVNDSSSGAPGGNVTTAGLIRSYYNYCINKTTRSQDKTKLMLAGQQHFEMLQGAMQALQRITSDGPTANSGYSELEYFGIPVAMCGGINFGGETQLSTDRTYGLNTRFTKVRIHKDAYMEPLPEMQSINQDAKAQLMIFMGNMTCRFPAGNWVMFDS